MENDHISLNITLDHSNKQIDKLENDIKYLNESVILKLKSDMNYKDNKIKE